MDGALPRTLGSPFSEDSYRVSGTGEIDTLVERKEKGKEKGRLTAPRSRSRRSLASTSGEQARKATRDHF